jgi:energy-coupling factor transporter ATP-binding protein EcfA2
MTNYRVSGLVDEKVAAAFRSIPGIDEFSLYGAEWLTARIRESARLRMLVPRVYGLGDLSQILDQRAYRQGREILYSMGDNLDKFVITDAYRKSARALDQHGFVLLLGEPASGKSTIAAILALVAVDLMGCSTLKILDAEEFVQHWNPDEPAQFFWVDDAFGATQYERDLALKWTRRFPHMAAALKKGARFIFTSRDYVFREARQDLKVGDFPLMDVSQVVIYVQKLTRDEKSRILYNHIKRGDQPKLFRARVKPFLPAVADSRRFLPETARRLGTSLLTAHLRLVERDIVRFVEEPVPFLSEVLSGLDRKSFAALALVFGGGGVLRSPLALSRDERGVLRSLGATEAEAQTALKAMSGSLTTFVMGEDPRWTFRHPTIRDALASLIAGDPERLDIYLRGSRVDTLLDEVTCGSTGIQGVRVVVPSSRYALFATRLATQPNDTAKYLFLAHRCGRPFLKAYLALDQSVLTDALAFAAYMEASPQVRFLARLHEYGLLPEAERLEFVKQAGELAVDACDHTFLTNPHVRDMLEEREVGRILQRVRNELVPQLWDLVWDWRSNCRSSREDPAGYFAPLVEALEAFGNEFSGDAKCEQEIAHALSSVEDAVADLAGEYEARAEQLMGYASSGERSHASEERSVFDDIDAE